MEGRQPRRCGILWPMGNGRSYRSTTIEKISFEVLKEEAEEDGTLLLCGWRKLQHQHIISNSSQKAFR